MLLQVLSGAVCVKAPSVFGSKHEHNLVTGLRSLLTAKSARHGSFLQLSVILCI
jgi:hypothetical protein